MESDEIRVFDLEDFEDVALIDRLTEKREGGVVKQDPGETEDNYGPGGLV